MGVLRSRKEIPSAPGPELNEYERVWSVPGMAMFTYWPGRKPRADRLSRVTVKPVVVSEIRSIAETTPVYAVTPVLATSEVVGIRSTQSDCGVIWQVRT